MQRMRPQRRSIMPGSSAWLVEVQRQRQRARTARLLDLVLQGREQLGAPGDDDRTHALAGQYLGDLAPESDAGAGDDGDLVAQLEVHRDLRERSIRLPTMPLGRKMMNRISSTP